MNKNQQAVFDSCMDISRILDDSHLKHVVNNVPACLEDKQKLSLGLIGRPHHRLFDIARMLLDINEIILGDAAASLHGSYKAKLTYNETFTCGIINPFGERITTHVSELEELLRDRLEDFGILELEIALNAPLLLEMDIVLLCSEYDYGEFDWYHEFFHIDFGVVLLSAIRLFSISEKNFLSGKAIPIMGRERMGAYICDYERLDSEGRNDVIETAEYYFNKIKGNIPIFYSADDTTQCELYAFVHKNLTADGNKYRMLKITQSLYVCIDEILKVSLRIMDSLTLNDGKLDIAVNRLSHAMESVEYRKKSTKRRIDMYINAQVKIPLIEKVSTFNGLLKSDVCSSLQKSSDFIKMKKLLPKYFDHIWTEFLNRQHQDILNQIQREMLEISAGIKQEIKDVIISEIDEESAGIIEGYPAADDEFKTFNNGGMMPVKSSHWASQISKYMSIGGIGAALLFTNIPLGLAALGGSYALKFLFKDNIENEKREKFINNVMSECDNAANEIIKHIESQFESICSSLKAGSDETYEKAFNDMLSMLNECKSAAENKNERQIYLKDIIENVLPELRNQLTGTKIKQIYF